MIADDINLVEGSEANGSSKRKKLMKNLGSYLTDYAKKSNIYGLKYLAEPNRSIAERFYWSVVLGTFFIISTVLIAQTWHKWKESPVTNFLQRPTPIWQIPFPAVTVCPEIKVKQTNYNFTKYLGRMVDVIVNTLSEEEKQIFSDVSTICDTYDEYNGTRIAKHDLIDKLMNIPPDLEDTLHRCAMNGVEENCKQHFFPILTEHGICFTYNMLNTRELYTDSVDIHSKHINEWKRSEGWTLEKGYPKNVGKTTYPTRALMHGHNAGMSLTLSSTKEDLHYICRGSVEGFTLTLHNPAQIPRLSTEFFQIPINKSVVLRVRPEVVTTSSELKGYSPRRKQCVFTEERPLKFFRTYTQENCHAECLANHSLAKCGCVMYYMPHKNSTAICGSGSRKCLHEAYRDFFHRQVESEISTFNTEETESDFSDCSCLPGCNSITYHVETSQSDLEWAKDIEKLASKGFSASRVKVVFKEKQFMSSERKKMYDETDFLANCGGLLSLFVGFSAFSLMEIIYFLSIRVIFNVRRYGRQFWSGPKMEGPDHPESVL